jgi:sugar lactone lactonase YvrE
LSVPLNSPAGLVLDPSGSGGWLLVSDAANHMLRKIWLNGTSNGGGGRTSATKHARWAGGKDNDTLGWENEGDDEIEPGPEEASTATSSSSSTSSLAPPAVAPTASTTPLTARRRMAAAVQSAMSETLASSSSSSPSSSSVNHNAQQKSQPKPRAKAVTTALSARFAHPAGLAWDSSAAVWVADRNNGKIKRIDATGRVFHVLPALHADEPSSASSSSSSSDVASSTVAAGAETAGSSSHQQQQQQVPHGIAGLGLGSLVRPEAVVQDARGQIVFSDRAAHCIRRYNPSDGRLTLLAGSSRRCAGFRDGIGPSEALFSEPTGLAIEPRTNSVFVCDTDNHAVRMITPTGQVVTIAGGGRNADDAGATAPQADDANTAAASVSSSRLQRPTSAATHRSYSGRAPPAASSADIGSAAGSSSSSSSSSSATSASAFSVEAGLNDGGLEGFVDGPGHSARFFRPEGLVYDPEAQVLYVIDTGNSAVRALHVEQAINATATATAASAAAASPQPAGGGFAALVPSDPFPTARLMQPAGGGSVSIEQLASARLNRYASMPSFTGMGSLTARPGTAASTGRPGSGSNNSSSSLNDGSLSSRLARKAASSSLALSALSSLPPSSSDPRGWTRLDVAFWLLGLQTSFEVYVPAFHAARIDGSALLDKCASEAFLQAQLGVASKMHRNAIVREVLRLKNPADAEEEDNDDSDDDGDGINHQSRSPSGGTSSRVASAGTVRPGSAGAWRPSSASQQRASEAAESLLSRLHLNDQPMTLAPSTAEAGAAASAAASSARTTPSPPPSQQQQPQQQQRQPLRPSPAPTGLHSRPSAAP